MAPLSSPQTPEILVPECLEIHPIGRASKFPVILQPRQRNRTQTQILKWVADLKDLLKELEGCTSEHHDRDTLLQNSWRNELKFLIIICMSCSLSHLRVDNGEAGAAFVRPYGGEPRSHQSGMQGGRHHSLYLAERPVWRS